MAILSTTEVCAKLGVSRAWVNNHIRLLGGVEPPDLRERSNKRTIYYDEDELLYWANSVAIFSRQTIRMDLCDFTPEKRVQKRLIELTKMPTNTSPEKKRRDAAYQKFLEEVLPEDLIEAHNRVHPRKRGFLPWVTVDHSIERLEDLYSMKDLKAAWGYQSAEMVYRDIFMNAMIRVELCGRCWYTKAPGPAPKVPIIFPIDD